MREGCVDQSIMHDPANGQFGNCMQACLASLLKKPLAEVPHFHHDGCDAETFWDRIEEWLADHNFLLRHGRVIGVLTVVSGPSARGTNHCVLKRDDELVWDPHPSRAGLLRENHHFYLLPNDPAQK